MLPKRLWHAALETLLAAVMLWPACAQASNDMTIRQLISPNKTLQVTFELRDGTPYYSVSRGEKAVLAPSRLGYLLADGTRLESGFALTGSDTSSVDERWSQPWGEVETVRDHHNAMTVRLRQSAPPHLKLLVHFRAYDDGMAFRYEIPRQEGLERVVIEEEISEFALPGDPTAWWIGAFQPNRYEYLYQRSPVSELDSVHTPLTMKTQEGLYLSLHEAALTDYASMALARTEGTTLRSALYPWSDGVKVRTRTPMRSPWRTLLVEETAAELITNHLVLNCNEPSRIEDTSWITPMKYVGIWWEMHLGVSSWGSGPDHGATTENTRRYIDFAAEHGFGGVLVEGWNTGWDGGWIDNGDLFSFTEPYPDYDLRGLAGYAREKGVRLIAHNETSTGILNYEQQMEQAFALYRELGINAIKSGYVGHGANIKRRDPETGEVLGLEWHHGQYMVNHYRRVVETAAKYGIMLDVHEPIKGTGIRRTWPNMMTREGARGQEYNAWSGDGGNPPEHTAILPFTRMLAGPFDFTPGIFNLLLEGADRPDNRVNTTLAKQLALYVVLFSPMQMAADLPEAYEGHRALQFIRDVPVNWSETVVLNGEIGEYVTLARREYGGESWFLGAISNEQPREYELPLDFLEAGRAYRAVIYEDGPGADWLANPLAYEIREEVVTNVSSLHCRIAPGGGLAVSFVPLER